MYECGIELFGWPVAYEIWLAYLQVFVEHYIAVGSGVKQVTKLERCRELFDRAVGDCSAELCRQLYVMYADVEEKYGLARRCITVYDRAVKSVSDEERMSMYQLYIQKAIHMFGITHARPVYEQALQSLPDAEAAQLATAYIATELKLGEIDRARAIYAYAAQFSDPRLDAQFWHRYEEFELAHGHELTFKEMLRVKRSVVAASNTDVVMLSRIEALADADAPLSQQFVAGGVTVNGNDAAGDAVEEVEEEEEPVAANPDEIVMSDDDSDIDSDH